MIRFSRASECVSLALVSYRFRIGVAWVHHWFRGTSCSTALGSGKAYLFLVGDPINDGQDASDRCALLPCFCCLPPQVSPLSSQFALNSLFAHPWATATRTPALWFCTGDAECFVILHWRSAGPCCKSSSQASRACLPTSHQARPCISAPLGDGASRYGSQKPEPGDRLSQCLLHLVAFWKPPTRLMAKCKHDILLVLLRVSSGFHHYRRHGGPSYGIWLPVQRIHRPLRD